MPRHLAQWLLKGCLPEAIKGAFDAMRTALDPSVLRISHDVDFGLIDLSVSGRMDGEALAALEAWRGDMPQRAVRAHCLPLLRSLDCQQQQAGCVA